MVIEFEQEGVLVKVGVGILMMMGLFKILILEPDTKTYNRIKLYIELPSHMGFSSKASACDRWVRKIHWRRAWQPTPVFLPGESQGLGILAGYSP